MTTAAHLDPLINPDGTVDGAVAWVFDTVAYRYRGGPLVRVIHTWYDGPIIGLLALTGTDDGTHQWRPYGTSDHADMIHAALNPHGYDPDTWHAGLYELGADPTPTLHRITDTPTPQPVTTLTDVHTALSETGWAGLIWEHAATHNLVTTTADAHTAPGM